MSQEGVNPAVALNQSNIAQALMEEDLQREITRNEAATKMAMDREVQALEARKRAQDSQVMMKMMLEKYDVMKNKLDTTKKHLDETTSKISVQEHLTDKIQSMKERIEAYANKKEAVNYLAEHVHIKNDMHANKLESVMEDMEAAESDIKPQEDSERYNRMKTGLEDHTERVEALRLKMQENEESLAKREHVKSMLEKQVLLGEKRAVEQARITDAREKLLELKMRELELQKAKLARRKREQEDKEKATDDFFAHIDKQLEDMESQAATAQETGAVPKQKPNKGKGKGRNRSKSNTPKVMSPEPLLQSKVNTPKVMSPEPKVNKIKVKTPEPKMDTPKVMSPEPVLKTVEVDEKPVVLGEKRAAEQLRITEAREKLLELKKRELELQKAKLARRKREQEEREKATAELLTMSETLSEEPKNMTPEIKIDDETSEIKVKETFCIDEPIINEEKSQPEVEAATEIDNKTPEIKLKETNCNDEPAIKVENSQHEFEAANEKPMDDAKEQKEPVSVVKENSSFETEESSGEAKMTEEEVKDMVAKVEGKCSNIRGDIADMAMSEQYLRTKQALLMAKKKEKEMNIAEKMATIREEEVRKMKEKVQHMQELLMSRKQKLKITEDIMEEKEGEKKQIDKQIEATKRRENYVEGQLLETVMFEKPPKKK
eukprot:GFUD01016054.1.p1 GENE.GFUD01016054.1~~GFUD01016054.1.p1  ORF type:complete len:662 (-),score=244.30 GFUD01016054.1:587-2572(-)